MIRLARTENKKDRMPADIGRFYEMAASNPADNFVQIYTLLPSQEVSRMRQASGMLCAKKTAKVVTFLKNRTTQITKKKTIFALQKLHYGQYKIL